MAVYGLDFYGLSKYGGNLFIDYGVHPFTAQAVSHTQIQVNWHEPSGDWNRFRVLVSRAGFASNPDDGTVVLEIKNGSTPQQLLDDVSMPGWYYYTIYIYSNENAQWERAGCASALAPTDYQSGQKLWELVPNYFKKIRDNTAGYSDVNFTLNPALYESQENTVDNQHLQQFLNVFGWGYDIIRTQIDTVLWGYQPDKMHFSRLKLLANQLGTDLEQVVPGATTRSLVRNLGLLYRKRGTDDGIGEIIALSTGWQVDIDLGPNIMLNEDQANFINPVVPPWDPQVRYVTGDHVQYDSYFYHALQTAYGPDQGPSSGGVTNTYWQHDNTIEENIELVRDDTGNIGTWEAYAVGAAKPLTTITSTNIGRGVTHPFDPTIKSTNALSVKNTLATTDDIIIRTPPWFLDDDDFDRELTQASTIPVPTGVTVWDPEVSYDRGDLVNFAGTVWEATRSTTRNPMSTDWKRLGYDRRVRLNLSFYTHGKFVGSATSNLVNPYVLVFNDIGDKLYEVVMDSSQVDDVIYDGMAQEHAFTPARPVDIGNAAWGHMKGLWTQDFEWDGDGFVYPEDHVQSYAFMDTPLSDCSVGVTYKSLGDRKMGILLRCSDNPIGPTAGGGYALVDIQNGWIVTQTEIYLIVAGVAQTPIADYSANPFEAGDRMIVTTDGDDVTLYKNDEFMLTVNNSFNNTATKHGLIALEMD